ncbi:MAG: 4-hydroxythreonine-4-phosphate dehydrogenase PdxA [Robiginitomaculum sp.]|nr:MAG: 4-hydroxythreonine-4-phosphate dehydrogenase PdxA [Robiginitomaculum sp.]
MGDPAGIGPEITAMAWQHLHDTEHQFFLIGDPVIFANALAKIGLPAPRKITDPSQCTIQFTKGLPILPIELATDAKPSQPDPANGPAILRSIEQAVQYCREGKASAMVTNPIAKSVLYKAGFAHPGHTEFLGELAKTFANWKPPHGPIMMLAGGGLRVALVSVHCALSEVPSKITAPNVERAIRVLHTALRQDFDYHAPRIALCALNPHAGEDGAMGREEMEILNPLAKRLRVEGIDVSDSIPADTLFREEARAGYDGVLAMYHDQGLIPVKTLDFHGGTNITLGLPFVRVSPDHGTGFDIAGQGLARPDSLIAALKLATQIAHSRNQTP